MITVTVTRASRTVLLIRLCSQKVLSSSHVLFCINVTEMSMRAVLLALFYQWKNLPLSELQKRRISRPTRKAFSITTDSTSFTILTLCGKEDPENLSPASQCPLLSSPGRAGCVRLVVSKGTQIAMALQERCLGREPEWRCGGDGWVLFWNCFHLQQIK